MTKREFISELSAKTRLTKVKAAETVDTMLDLIVESCEKRDAVKFAGFGIFEARQVKATNRINPQNGQRITLPAKWVPKFRAGAVFKNSVNSN